MKTISSKEIEKQFPALLEVTQQEPIGITDSDRVVSVLLSIEEYEKLTELHDSYWGYMAKQAKLEGFIGHEESMKFIQERLDENPATDTQS